MEVFSFVFSPIEVNTYLLVDKSGDCAILDCGCYRDDEFDRLASFIGDKGLNPVYLLNTHCHPDHIFGNGRVLEKYGLRSCFHKEEDDNLHIAVKYAMFFDISMDEPPEAGRYLKVGEIISFGEISLKTLFVPGHSAGSLAFYNENDGIVFTGDALFGGSIGRTDLYRGDYKQLITSIRNELFTLPADTIICPGHGGESTIGVEIESNPYFNQI